MAFEKAVSLVEPGLMSRSIHRRPVLVNTVAARCQIKNTCHEEVEVNFQKIKSAEYPASYFHHGSLPA